METSHFRDIVDGEIQQIVEHFDDDDDFKKLKTPENQHSFAFLLWFLKSYHPGHSIKELKEYITEGNGDSSCDMIFNNKDRIGREVYYVVQAKWFKTSKVMSSNKTGQMVKATIADFQLILDGQMAKSTDNKKFNEKYDELTKHVQNNGKVKFIFLALCKRTSQVEKHISQFERNNGELIKMELYDINRLKTDYIELYHKMARTHNPIETPYEPIGEIDLEIDVRNNIKIEQPNESYIFLVTPKLIHGLFHSYQYALFYRNIRNPLSRSNFNEAISETLTHTPSRFWYYNNGITAITNRIHQFNLQAKKITVEGINVINGAQTVYSIYDAYHRASDDERKYIDERVLITFRIITSSGRNEDMKITKYTNSQNPIIERDFHANDQIQKDLQVHFFHNTNLWYETRRDEFRKKPPRGKGIQIVGNDLFAQAYLSYRLEEPILAKSSKKNLFLTKDESDSGLYEKIFNEKTDYEDMLVSYLLYRFIEQKRNEFRKAVKKIENKDEKDIKDSDQKMLQYRFLQYTTFNIVAAFRQAALLANPGKHKSINNKLLDDLRRDCKVVETYYEFIKETMKKLVLEKQKSSSTFYYGHYFKSQQESVHDIKTKLQRRLSHETNKKKLKLK